MTKLTKPIKEDVNTMEEEFDKFYPELLTEAGEVSGEVKAFINKELSLQRKAIVERLEGIKKRIMKWDKTHYSTGEPESSFIKRRSSKLAHNKTLDQAINIIKREV